MREWVQPSSKRDDRRSPEAAAYRKMYKSSRWRRLRYQQLLDHPLCGRCLRSNPRRLTPATVVHHLEPHRGDPTKFFDPANLISSCKPHHDSDEQQIERIGYSTEIGHDGWPTDPRHPANHQP
jgi:5-methylcytosine-specific restriction enzyme A